MGRGSLSPIHISVCLQRRIPFISEATPHPRTRDCGHRSSIISQSLPIVCCRCLNCRHPLTMSEHALAGSEGAIPSLPPGKVGIHVGGIGPNGGQHPRGPLAGAYGEYCGRFENRAIEFENLTYRNKTTRAYFLSKYFTTSRILRIPRQLKIWAWVNINNGLRGSRA